MAHSGDVCSDSENGVGISGLFASKQGLHHGQEVMDTLIKYYELLRSLLEPLAINSTETKQPVGTLKGMKK